MDAEQQETEGGGVKYPNCTVELLGTTANSVAIFRKVRRELIRYLVNVEGVPRDKAEVIGDEFQTEATSGDSDNVLATCFRWVDVS